ncbi:MAG: DUF5758 domain-containing protein [Rhizobiaceae bacterium]
MAAKAKKSSLVKFEIKNRWTGDVQFTAEIEADDNTSFGVKVGLAVKWAIKSRANLYGADLYGANLSRANLSRANLSGANLSCAKNADLVIARTRILPDGDLIGWKKCSGDVIVKLRIPETAKRSHAFGRKCRAEYADVLEVIGAARAFPSMTARPNTSPASV